jgi:hypothetical protein
MRDRWLAAAAWTALTIVIAIAALVSLRACDLGGPGIFGLRYCEVKAPPDRLAAEREREQNLRDLIHKAELRMARLPICAPPPPPQRPPQREATVDPPRPPAQPPRELTIPRTLADLEGCWQSARGDIPMYSTGAERHQVGNVRICYCFSGQSGTARYIYTDGSKCSGPLQVQLAQDRLSFSHERISCTGRAGHVVPVDMVCKSGAGGEAATCDRVQRDGTPSRMTNEKFNRVPPQHCD